MLSQCTNHALKSYFVQAFAEAEGTLCTTQTYGPSEQWDSSRPADCSSSDSDQTRIGTDSAVLTSQVPTKDMVIVPTKRKSRRKMDPKRVPINKEMKFSEIIFNDWPYKYSTLQEKWFYSAIDYPWFAKREFDEYLSHVRLGHIPRLTRVEWGVIRSSLGKPRRFCENFLHEEREKLKQYRESVRKHYSELRAGVREGLPTDLARPLSVGQRVIAIHPKSREVHDGRVLTVDHDKCRIQFDRPELGVEFVMDTASALGLATTDWHLIVLLLLQDMRSFILACSCLRYPHDKSDQYMPLDGRKETKRPLLERQETSPEGMTDVQFQDIDCLPLNPLENMPEALRRQNIPIDRFSAHARAGYTLSEHLENVESPMNTKSAKRDMIYASRLNQKDIVNAPQEAILMELKHVNNDLLKSQNTGDSFLKDSEPFRKQYAMLLQQLKEVSSALLNLRQRNSYPVNSLPPWPKPLAMPCGLSDPLVRFSTDSQEFGSNVVGIVTNSRSKAQMMVAAAIQAISSLKEGEDAFASLGEALDCLSSQNFQPDSVSLINRSPERVSGFTSMPEPMIGHASGPMLPHDFGRSEGRIPSALVSSCVASVLMIQGDTDVHGKNQNPNFGTCASLRIPWLNGLIYCTASIISHIAAIVTRTLAATVAASPLSYSPTDSVVTVPSSPFAASTIHHGSSLAATFTKDVLQKLSHTVVARSSSYGTPSSAPNLPGHGRGLLPTPSSTGGSPSRSLLVCQICPKRGHSALNCCNRFNHSYTSDDLLCSFSAMMVAETSDAQWYSDNGASTHKTPNNGMLFDTSSYTGSSKI
ncbi:hypothetical protein RJ640_024775 [Escallonia rubra]|uniref:DIRP domain-containing protein n=1 Tax=Escallonia rubra TaxID=112253 RepID=A0AA88QW42_9ASTE|nr:hypothetical protein RJ640_024775 [Escallonia rubra]